MNQTREIITTAEEQLRSRGFSDRTIQHHRRCWKRLMAYLDRNGIGEYDPISGIRFLAEEYGIMPTTEAKDKTARSRVRSIKYLNDYIDFGTVFPTSPPVSAAGSLQHFKSLLEEFKRHQCCRHSISETTLVGYDKNVGKFLLYLESRAIFDASLIGAEDVRAFLPAIAAQSDGVAYNISCSLRVFLRYLKESDTLKTDLSGIVPSFAYRRKSKLPSSMSQDEVSQILASVDRSGPVGKRDYAIILLACRLGLRSTDIRNLTFSEIRWETNSISLAQRKTGVPLTLPLSEEVGCALIDYLKGARPTSDSGVVFLTMNAPTRAISGTGITAIVKKYAAKAGIETTPERHVGPHLMRNALASALLKEGVSLPEISGILGHSSTSTTQQYYLRIDDAQLRQCALSPRFWAKPEEEVF